ncbi:MAG: aspartate aminotransferase family protein [Methylohalobius crimeensis]
MTNDASVLKTIESDSEVGQSGKSARDFLFNAQNLKRYKEAILQGLELVHRNIANSRKPFTGTHPHELAERFRDIDLDQSFSRDSEVLAEVQALYLDDAVYFHHPSYAAHLNCPVVVPALLGELIASSINTAVETWDQSAGATFIEQKLIDWTAGKIGLQKQADGVFTSGGTQSNLMALLLARDWFCAKRGHDIKTRGLPADFAKLRIFASEIGHFSLKKAAATLGLGYEAVIPVPCDRYFRMDPHALRREIKRCQDRGLLPMAVVSTAGTTDFGSIDPLPEIATLGHARGMWVHTDAAYGCGLLVSPKHRHLLRGIELSDSVTVDYHKSFFQPVSCSALLVSDKRHLSAVTYHADYLNPRNQLPEGTFDLVNKSMQTTRRFDALKLWLTLRTVGARNIGEAFDRVMHLTRQTYLLFLSDPSIEVIHQPQLSTLVFRFHPSRQHSEAVLDEVNASIRKALYRSGEALVAGTKVRGHHYLKCTLLNPAATIQDIQGVLKRIKQHGQEALAKQKTDHSVPVSLPDSYSLRRGMENARLQDL